MPGTSRRRPSLRVIAGDLAHEVARDAGAAAAAVRTIRESLAPSADSASLGDRDEPEPSDGPTRIAVIGGGIAGLAAAWALVKDRSSDIHVTIYEATTEVGGKIKLGEIVGIPIDEGAESLLAVRPEALALTRSVGLSGSIVHPTTSQASLWSRGQLRPLPQGLITGIPTELRALASSGILSVPGLLRIPLDHLLPQTHIDFDISVGDYVATRLGREVVDRLVEPMLGGVYAGRAQDLSLEMTVPALFRLAKRDRSLLSAAREARATGAAPAGARRGPVFAGIIGGVGRLPIALADRLTKRGVSIETGATVTGLRSSERGWRLIVSHGGHPQRVDVDAVVLAAPAASAARLLRQANPHAAAILDGIDYASVGLVTLAYAPQDVPATIRGSGMLVPPIEGLAVKAATYSSRKWAWVARSGAVRRSGSGSRTTRNYLLVRASVGRYGEAEVLGRDDDELAELVAAELQLMAGLPPKPVAHLVTRWGAALPQYTVGHRSRIAQVRELLIDTPGISVCGAAYDGVGIAACVGSAQFAASQLVSYLAEKGQWAHG